MKNVMEGKRKCIAGLIALGLLPLGGGSTAWAKDHSSAGAIAVVSSKAFDGKPATDMELEQESGKSYLRIVFGAGEPVEVLDVTKPENGLEALAPAMADEPTAINKNLVLVRAGTAGATASSASQ